MDHLGGVSFRFFDGDVFHLLRAPHLIAPCVRCATHAPPVRAVPTRPRPRSLVSRRHHPLPRLSDHPVRLPTFPEPPASRQGHRTGRRTRHARQRPRHRRLHRRLVGRVPTPLHSTPILSIGGSKDGSSNAPCMGRASKVSYVHRTDGREGQGGKICQRNTHVLDKVGTVPCMERATIKYKGPRVVSPCPYTPHRLPRFLACSLWNRFRVP